MPCRLREGGAGEQATHEPEADDEFEPIDFSRDGKTLQLRNSCWPHQPPMLHVTEASPGWRGPFLCRGCHTRGPGLSQLYAVPKAPQDEGVQPCSKGCGQVHSCGPGLSRSNGCLATGDGGVMKAGDGGGMKAGESTWENKYLME